MSVNIWSLVTYMYNSAFNFILWIRVTCSYSSIRVNLLTNKLASDEWWMVSFKVHIGWRNLFYGSWEAFQWGGGGGGVCCCFVTHFWDFLSPGRLGENVAVTFLLGWKCCCRISINMAWQIKCLEKINFYWPFYLKGPFLSNTIIIIRKGVKENNRKCLQGFW